MMVGKKYMGPGNVSGPGVDMTLKDRMMACEELIHGARELDMRIFPAAKVQELQAKILEDYLTKDVVALRVYRGNDSYSNHIEPILKKYATERSRKTMPKEESRFDSFDFDTELTITVINDIGAAHLDYQKYTTKGRRDILMWQREYDVVVGGMFGLRGAFDLHTMYTQHAAVNSTIAGLSVTTLCAIAYAVMSSSRRGGMGARFEADLRELRSAAQKTDSYIQRLASCGILSADANERLGKIITIDTTLLVG